MPPLDMTRPGHAIFYDLVASEAGGHNPDALRDFINQAGTGANGVELTTLYGDADAYFKGARTRMTYTWTDDNPNVAMRRPDVTIHRDQFKDTRKAVEGWQSQRSTHAGSLKELYMGASQHVTKGASGSVEHLVGTHLEAVKIRSHAHESWTIRASNV